MTADPARMACRSGCAACCIAPSISTPLPGLPRGKPAGVPCPHLTAALGCALFGRAERPRVCVQFRPEPAVCGADRAEALRLLGALERASQSKASITART